MISKVAGLRAAHVAFGGPFGLTIYLMGTQVVSSCFRGDPAVWRTDLLLEPISDPFGTN